MKRRDFLVGSTSMLGVMVPMLARAQTIPCPPPALSVDDQPAVESGCEPSALTEIAAALGAGQSSTALADTGLSSDALHAIQWCNRFHFDYSHGRAYLLGKDASSQGGERANCVYEMSSNQWTAAVWDADETGHVYESIAFDPMRSEVYTGQWRNGETLKRWKYGEPLTSWTDPATSRFGDYINSDTQPTLCWHPNLFGSNDGGVLVLKNSGTSRASVIAWRRSDNSWHTVPGTEVSGMSGSYLSNGAIEYVWGGDFCIASFSPGKGGTTFRIDAGSNGKLASAVQISDVPIHCGYTGTGNVGILIDDPAGGAAPYILEKGGSNRVWKYNAGNWFLKDYQHPFPDGRVETDPFWVVATCRPLGVFWSKSQSRNNPSYLWRPND